MRCNALTIGSSLPKKLLKQERVNFIAPAEYTEDSLNYKIVCSIIDKIKADYELQRLKSAR